MVVNVYDVPFKTIESTGDTDDMKPGEAIVFDYSDGTKGLILCCPNCGRASSSSTGNPKYNEATQTVTPSIIHDKALGGCGWHGHLKNGKFV